MNALLGKIKTLFWKNNMLSETQINKLGSVTFQSFMFYKASVVC